MSIRRIAALATAGALLETGPALALDPDLQRVRPVLASAELVAGEDSLALTVDAQTLARLAALGAAVVEGFPLPGGEAVDLVLRSFDPIAAGAVFVEGTPSGDRPFTPPAMRFFRGRVDGREGSLAYLWIHGRRLGGFIELGAAGHDAFRPHRFLFGPRSPRLDEPESHVHAVAADRGSFSEDGPYCTGHESVTGGEGLPGTADLLGSLPRPGIASSTLLQADLAFDATVEYFNRFGDLTAAAAYLESLLGAVSTIYEADVLCQLRLGFLRVFSAEPDPYRSTGVSTTTLLADLRAEWTTNPAVTSVPRALTHLLTVQPGVGGRAYLNVLCNTSYGYGVSGVHGTYTYPNAGYTWDADVVAHELGHNFASAHTHCYTPEIDRCYNGESGCYSGPVEPSVGTIMSYCHLVASKTLSFSSRERDVIRPAIEAAACIEAAGNPGELAGDAGSGLMLVKDKLAQALASDDGAGNGSSGYTGTTRAAWIKRFTPPCSPYRLDSVELEIAHPSVAAGRPLELLVYEDPGATGDPAAATLTYTQAVSVQTVGSGMSSFALADPPLIASGDVYLGFYDLLADPADTYTMSIDTSSAGDSYRKANSTTPSGYGAVTGATFRIRASGVCADIDALRLSWGAPCNDLAVPGQDFAVYQGTLAQGFDDHQGIACGTGKGHALTVAMAPGSQFFRVAPMTSAAEGGHGPQTPLPASSCRPLALGPCD